MTDVSVNQGSYSIVPKAPDGITVFSETHQFPSEWYNNRNPVFSWEKAPNLTGFSYIFDNNPFTTPDNIPEDGESLISYNDTHDGLWYFHIKAKKGNVWGATTHSLVRIDGTPPAKFTPEVEIVSTKSGKFKALVSFFTTDALSGIDHYEVGVMEKDAPQNSYPIFVETKSPYEVPYNQYGSRVIIRAYDEAGNITDSDIDISFPVSYIQIAKDNLVLILVLIILFLLVLTIMHYLTGRKMVIQTNTLLQMSKQNVTTKPRELVPMIRPGQDQTSSTFYR